MKPFNLEEYLKNPSKKTITRDGKNARIICTDKKGTEYPIVALIDEGREEQFFQCTKNGKSLSPYTCDLFFAPEKKEGWINVYKHEGENVFSSKAEAEKDGKRFSNYVAAVKIEWEE